MTRRGRLRRERGSTTAALHRLFSAQVEAGGMSKGRGRYKADTSLLKMQAQRSESRSSEAESRPASVEGSPETLAISLGNALEQDTSPNEANGKKDNGKETENEGDPVKLTLAEMAVILRSLPTKEDMKGLIMQTINPLKQEIMQIKQGMHETEGKMSAMQSEMGMTAQKFAKLETLNNQYELQISALTMQVDDMENRSRRNNIKIRGLPETVLQADLKITVCGMLNTILERPVTLPIEIDRIHRIGPYGGRESTLPRDIICRVHFFGLKEEIMRRAWLKGPYVHEGTSVVLLPDLSRRTLAMRRLLKPLLEEIHGVGGTYTWGYPFSLMVRRNNKLFGLYQYNQLEDLCIFLGIRSIDIPDWTNLGSVQRRNPQEQLWTRKNMYQGKERRTVQGEGRTSV